MISSMLPHCLFGLLVVHFSQSQNKSQCLDGLKKILKWKCTSALAHTHVRNIKSTRAHVLWGSRVRVCADTAAWTIRFHWVFEYMEHTEADLLVGYMRYGGDGADGAHPCCAATTKPSRYVGQGGCAAWNAAIVVFIENILYYYSSLWCIQSERLCAVPLLFAVAWWIGFIGSWSFVEWFLYAGNERRICTMSATWWMVNNRI